MTKKAKVITEIKIERPERMKLSAEESLKRTKEFDKRKEKGAKVRHHPEKLARVVLLCAMQTRNLLVSSER
jgi:hypothetical protein